MVRTARVKTLGIRPKILFSKGCVCDGFRVQPRFLSRRRNWICADPISIQFFFAPLENRRNRRPTWPVYIIIYWYSDTSGFLLLLLLLLYVVYTNAHSDPKYACDRRPSRETRAWRLQCTTMQSIITTDNFFSTDELNNWSPRYFKLYMPRSGLMKCIDFNFNLY